MRRTRRMTTGERWELGLFMSMLIVACLIVTAAMRMGGVPKAAAWEGEAVGTIPATVKSDEITMADAPSLRIGPETQGELLVTPSLAESAQQLAVRPAAAPLPEKAAKPVIKAVPADIKTFNGQKYKFVKTLKLRVTAYAPDPRCTYPYPGTTTASGKSVKTNGGKLVAADTGLIPMHSLVVVPGYAGSGGVPVLDKGGAIKGSRLDVLMQTYELAQGWGSKMLDVKVYAPVK